MRLKTNIIIKPIISEKSFAETKIDKYTFVVRRDANKTDIKNAVEKTFGVTVIGVYTANVKGTKTKNTKTGKKIIDTTYKKARVMLKKGEKIAIFAESSEEKKDNKEKKEKK